ncbi:YceD family protein [Acidicapsa dinghuensis]|uniref:YceD family protein n=1 Tax=Acidicapsa dinghuensis TaxID=2218256 RepID=A0ABW1EHK6_9BACT|nr:DUF177 domain-containing protein [Acidicapsa dinghuensis]
MFFAIPDLEREPIQFSVALPPKAIDFGGEAEQVGDLTSEGRAEVLHEHRGPKEIVPDIRLKGSLRGTFEAPCARCVEPVRNEVAGDFDLLFRPSGVDAEGSEHSISTPETEIGYYEKDGLALEDVLREQVLLSLPARSLCQPDCKGLCPRCGQNRNEVACSCEQGPDDPRWEALSGLGSRIKH